MRAMRIDDFLEQERTEPGWAKLVAEGRAARAAADGGAWRIGRLAAQVERRYASGSLKRFAEAIGESAGTVRRFRWVAEAYPEADRLRFPGLSFSHFQAVAGLPDRLVWLERAIRGTWSVDRLVTESRVRGSERAAQVARLRRPIESASRSLIRLTEQLEGISLTRAARTDLQRAADELAGEVEALRARLRTPSRIRAVR